MAPDTDERVADLERRVDNLAPLEPAVGKLAHAAVENGNGSVIEAAAETADRVAQLRDRVGRLENRIVDLEDSVERLQGRLNGDGQPYEELTRAQKVARVRQYLTERAQERPNARAAMDYDDLLALFDGKPSRGHVYDLLEGAAEAEGFTYDERSGEKNRLLVDLEAANG